MAPGRHRVSAVAAKLIAARSPLASAKLAIEPAPKLADLLDAHQIAMSIG